MAKIDLDVTNTQDNGTSLYPPPAPITPPALTQSTAVDILRQSFVAIRSICDTAISIIDKAITSA